MSIRGAILLMTLGVLAAVLTWGVVIDGSQLRSRPNAASAASPPRGAAPSKTTTTVVVRSRSSVSGTLVRASADTITVRQDNGETVEVKLDPGTTVCRIVCTALWTELRPGDDIFAGLEASGSTTVTLFIDANLAGGWAVVDAVEPGALVVHWQRAGTPTTPFRLFVGWATRWDGTGPDARACPGDTVYFTGSSDRPRTPDEPTPDVWATLVNASPSPGCTTSIDGVRVPTPNT